MLMSHHHHSNLVITNLTKEQIVSKILLSLPLFVVRARTIYIDFNMVFSTALPENPSLRESPKATSTSIRISEGYGFDAALEDEHHVLNSSFLFCLGCFLAVCHCCPVDNRCDAVSFFNLQTGGKNGAAFAETFMKLRTISASSTSSAFISVFCAAPITALDWSLLAPDVEMPVFCCTHQSYDWLTMTFERRHCVETPREMDVGNTALYRLVSRTHRSPGIGVLQMPLTLHLFLDRYPFATVIAQLDIVMEFDCHINGLLEPGEVHSSEGWQDHQHFTSAFN